MKNGPDESMDLMSLDTGKSLGRHMQERHVHLVQERKFPFWVSGKTLTKSFAQYCSSISVLHAAVMYFPTDLIDFLFVSCKQITSLHNIQFYYIYFLAMNQCIKELEMQ